MPGVGAIPEHWIQKIEILQEKAIIIIKFLPNNAPVSKEMHKLRILKLIDFITLQNVLFVYDCLEQERMKSFNTIFKQVETNQFYNTRSFKEILKQKNLATSLYWAKLYQTGTYSKML